MPASAKIRTAAKRRSGVGARGSSVIAMRGSSDVTDEFLEAVNPAAFVISSGDEEGHVHTLALRFAELLFVNHEL